MTNIDTLVDERMSFFHERKGKVSTMERELALLSALCEKEPLNFSAKEKKKSLEREINDINNDTSEIDYLLKVAPLIKEYFETKEQTVSSEQPAKAGTAIDQIVEHESKQCRGKVFKKYMVEIEGDTRYYDPEIFFKEGMQNFDEDTCTISGCSGQIIRCKDDTCCSKCGVSYDWMVHEGTFELTYEQRINDVQPIYTYRRANHFSEWLSKLQSKEMTTVPDTVIDAIKSELKKARITDPSKIDQKKVKFYLKKLKLSKFYEHSAQITHRLAGIQPPSFSTGLEAKLRQMFEEIQKPFEIFRPAGRSNFLSYGFVLYKFCELLCEDQYLPYLPLLKSFSKLHQQDMIWKDICTFLRWQFIPSV